MTDHLIAKETIKKNPYILEDMFDDEIDDYIIDTEDNSDSTKLILYNNASNQLIQPDNNMNLNFDNNCDNNVMNDDV